MEIKTQSKSELDIDNIIPNETNNIYPVIDWTLDIGTHHFTYDKALIKTLFKSNITINKIADLLKLITIDKREQVSQVFR
jgi:hypothetical protein